MSAAARILRADLIPTLGCNLLCDLYSKSYLILSVGELWNSFITRSHQFETSWKIYSGKINYKLKNRIKKLPSKNQTREILKKKKYNFFCANKNAGKFNESKKISYFSAHAIWFSVEYDLVRLVTLRAAERCRFARMLPKSAMYICVCSGDTFCFITRAGYVCTRGWRERMLCVCRSFSATEFILPCDLDESDAAPEFSIVIGGEFSRTHDISPADI